MQHEASLDGYPIARRRRIGERLFFASCFAVSLYLILGHEWRSLWEPPLIALAFLWITFFSLYLAHHHRAMLLDVTGFRWPSGTRGLWPTVLPMTAWVVSIWLSFRGHSGTADEWTIWIGETLAIAVIEELLFRGLVYGGAEALSGRPWVAIAVSSVIFSLVHLDQIGTLPTDFVALNSFGALAGGVLFAAMRYRTGSFVTAIPFHALSDIPAMITLSRAHGVRLSMPPHWMAHMGVEILAMAAAGAWILAPRHPFSVRRGRETPES